MKRKMKRPLTVALGVVLMLFSVTGCPTTPNPFCPGNVCEKAPTSTTAPK